MKHTNYLIKVQIFLFFAALTSLFLLYSPISAKASDIPALSLPSVDQTTTNTPGLTARSAEFEALRQTNTLAVIEIIDPVTVKLSNQTIARLSGIDIPDLTPYESGPIAEEALNELKNLLENHKVKIYQTKKKDQSKTNRFGHLITHLVTTNEGIWTQGYLLEKGLARVRPTKENTEMSEQMLKLEDIARREKRGLWSDKTYQIRPADQTEGTTNDWAIIEGVVKSSATINNKTYLNFGSDWKTDFTIGIPANIRKQLIKNNIQPLALTHKKVRVRGWVENYNGHYIELMNSIWLQLLPDDTDALIVEQN